MIEGTEAEIFDLPKPPAIPYRVLELRNLASELDPKVIDEVLQDFPELGRPIEVLEETTDSRGRLVLKAKRLTPEDIRAGNARVVRALRYFAAEKAIEKEVYSEPPASAFPDLCNELFELEEGTPAENLHVIAKRSLAAGLSGQAVIGAFAGNVPEILDGKAAQTGFMDSLYQMAEAACRDRRKLYDTRLKELELKETKVALRWNAEKYSDITADIRRPALVAGLIGEGSLVLGVGLPKGGKTFAFLHLGECIATGNKFFGHKVTQGAVLYVALEGGFAILKRITAMKKKRGHDDAPLYLARISLDLGNPKDVEDLIALAKHVGEVSGMPLRLIVIDTYARAIGGRDENSATDTGLVVRNLDFIRAQTGAAVLPIHHTAKSGEQERGSSALSGAYDGKLKVTHDPKSGERKIVLENPRDFDFAPDMHFTLENVVLGKDDNGDLVSSAVVVEGGSPQSHDGEFEPRSVEGKAFEALRAAIDAEGVERTGSDGIFTSKWVSAKAWQAKFTEMFYPNAGRSTASTAFARGSRKVYASQSVARKGVNVAIK